jgi:predicted ester cyclase
MDPRTALAETYLVMLNTHEPDLVNRFVAEDYRNHNAYVADGREANRQFWTAFFTALPDLTATMEDLVISGDRVVGRFTYRGTHTGRVHGHPRHRQPGRDALHRHLASRGRHVRRTLG